jgi:cytochrome c oxidase subunit 3
MQPLPVGSEGKRSGGWWGVLALIVTEGSLFGYLLFTYFYLASQTEQHWPSDGLPILLMPGVNTLILLASSVFVWASERCIQRSQLRWSFASMALALILGICFVVIQLKKLRYDIGSVWITVFHHHRISYASCHCRIAYPDDASGVDCARLF